MSNSSFDKDFWTRVLDENGLETPGYHEAVQATQEAVKNKKMLEKTETKKRKKK